MATPTNLFFCPAPTALGTFASTACPVRWDQIQKLAFQRVQATTPFANEVAVETLAGWTAFMAAADSTKIVISPYITNLVITPTEAAFEGGNDNTTINGIRRLNGGNTATATFEIRNYSGAVLSDFKELTSESAKQAGFSNLTAYFFNKNRQVVYDGANAFFQGIKIYNFIVNDYGSEGYNKDNVAMGSFDLTYGWSEGVAIADPTDFNPLTL